jgi:hypothetical protein
MRVRLDPVARHHVQRIADHFGRSPSNAVAAAVNEYARLHLGLGATEVMSKDEIENTFGRGKPILVHTDGALAAAVKDFAEQDCRSLSSAVKFLLREALKSRGVAIHYRAP